MMKKLSFKFWFLLFECIVYGALIGYMDTSPHWADLGITVGVTLVIAFLFGLVMPEFAWLWAFIIGGFIFGLNLIFKENYSSVIAFVYAFAGSYLGVFITNQLK